MLKKLFKVLLGIIAIVIIGFYLGPKPSFKSVDNTPLTKRYEIAHLDQIIDDRETDIENLKEDNEARIIWADSIPTKTEYSIVYMHGFTASHGEGYPLHINLADSLSANLYLPRFSEHGILDKNAMKNLTPKMMVDDARDAIAIGKTIGEKLIVIGCSTGGTTSIYLASNDQDITALVLLSPNIEIRSSSMTLLTGPWGRQLAYQMIGEHRDNTTSQSNRKYWSYLYHTNGLIALQSLIDQTMKEEIFNNVSMPVYCGYFYKNEDIQDSVVSVEAMLTFGRNLKVAKEDVEFEAFENGNHVLGSIYKNDNWQKVQDEVLDFIKREIVEVE